MFGGNDEMVDVGYPSWPPCLCIDPSTNARDRTAERCEAAAIFVYTLRDEYHPNLAAILGEGEKQWQFVIQSFFIFKISAAVSELDHPS